MTQNEREDVRRSVETRLGQAWALFQEVQDYVGETPGVAAGVPDFHQRALEIVPDPQQQAADALQRVSLSQIAQLVANCSLCALGSLRTHAVPGEGVANARLMVIGEGPGAEEDRTGRPFVGKAGKYLDSWLTAIGLDRSTNVFIANIVKCRPPENRDPLPQEAQACIPYLKRQIALVKPDGILCVGKVAAHFLLGREDALHALRGTIHRFEGLPVVVTYHPAAVLRNLQLRRSVWEDLKRTANVLNLPVPNSGR